MLVWAHIAKCLEGGRACAMVTVARADGSTPREAGARMVVRPDKSFSGTIGGGTLELEAIRLAAGLAEAGEAGFVRQTVSLGPDLGQCCGGRVDLAIEVLTPEALPDAQTFARREAGGSAFATAAFLSEGAIAERKLADELPADPIRLSVDPVTGKQLLLERFGATRQPLYLFGAGHVGKSLVLALAPLDFDITWIDSRSDQFPAAVPAATRKTQVNEPAEVLADAPDGAFVLAMTHSHALDEDIVARALLQQRFAYVGVIGSETKRSRFHKRLKARGLNDTLLSKMVCPVGITALRSKQPSAIAAGIAVDLLMRKEAIHQQAAVGEGLAQIIPHGQ